LFSPMADTTIFALIGSLLLTLTIVPVLCYFGLGRRTQERHNPAFEWVKEKYRASLNWSLAHRNIVIWTSTALFAVSVALTFTVGSEFMPTLDEGALWVRTTMPYTISLEESAKIVPQVRKILKSFPEVTDVTSEHGRDDGATDPTGFYNAEFYVGLKPYAQWNGTHKTKDALIADIDKKLSAFPGLIVNFSQPANDAVQEAQTGLKSALDVKLFGPNLTVLQNEGLKLKRELETVPGIAHVTLVQELGQPSLTVTIDRAKLARYGLSADAVNGLINAAVGGTAATQVVQGEETFDLVVRLKPEFRSTPEAIGNILVATPGGSQVPLRELAAIEVNTGAALIYRQDGSRYIGIQYSIEGRDLASAVEAAKEHIDKTVHLPAGYRTVWGGEYEEYKESRTQLAIVLPITIGLIFLLLFSLYHNVKFALITLVGVALSGPIGGMLALTITGTHFSVSSGIGFLALFGVSVQTAVVYISYANELRLGGMAIEEATREAAMLRLRPIMMTALVAAFGLLPAALATGVGTDSQRPFALVIVGGLFSRLFISVLLMPVLYGLVARPNDHLEV